ncbi:MAG: SusD/RagB family nutrient-binding outer membrane lipoprotein, partial [Chitinophagaceae bacterium]
LNPNADVRVPPENLLPQIISAMAGNYAGHGTMNDIRFIGAYIQNWQYHATLSNYDRMGYTNNVADVSQSTWRMHYYDIGQNNQRMIEWGAEEKKWDYVGVGKAIEAWSWLTLTDYYGDVILKEAFNTTLL